MLDAEAFKLTCDVSNRASRRLLPLGVPRAYAPNAQPEPGARAIARRWQRFARAENHSTAWRSARRFRGCCTRPKTSRNFSRFPKKCTKTSHSGLLLIGRFWVTAEVLP